jgi:hypothetical protein
MEEERVQRYDVDAIDGTGRIGTLRRHDGSAVDVPRDDAADDPIAQARADMLARNKDAWKTGKKWDEHRDRHAKNAWIPGAKAAASNPQSGDDAETDPDTVGERDDVKAARDAMVAKGKDAWKTPRRNAKKSR